MCHMKGGHAFVENRETRYDSLHTRQSHEEMLYVLKGGTLAVRSHR